MTSFTGDFQCKVDPKGRIMLPQAYKRGMSGSACDIFIVKKNIYFKCLEVCTLEVWQQKMDEVTAKLNLYDPEHQILHRELFKDTAEIELDASNRMLIPARLLKMAGIQKEVILAGQNKQFEIWDIDLFEENRMSSENFQALSKKILVNNKTNI